MSYIQTMVIKAAGLSNSILRSTINRDANFMVTFHHSSQAHFRLLLLYVECWL